MARGEIKSEKLEKGGLPSCLVPHPVKASAQTDLSRCRHPQNTANYAQTPLSKKEPTSLPAALSGLHGDMCVNN